MKVFSFIGSRKNENSNTYKVIKLLINEIKKYDLNLENKIVFASDLELKQCEECLNCFNNGFCPNDRKDHFDDVKKEILESDVVILGTPVLGATVSGEMKKFIDRLSYWLHLMPLASKIGVSVVTASSNSLMETNTYLKKIMESLGLFVPCSILCTVDMPNMIDSNEFRNIIIKDYAKEIRDYVFGYKKIYSSKYQNAFFKNLKDGFDVSINSKNAELKYWREHNLTNYENFEEVITDLIKKRFN